MVVAAFIAELSDTLKPSKLIRTYFGFLNTIFGRGMFLMFMAIIVVEIQERGEIFICIFCFIIGVVDVIVGWKEMKEGLPSPPWQQNDGG